MTATRTLAGNTQLWREGVPPDRTGSIELDVSQPVRRLDERRPDARHCIGIRTPSLPVQNFRSSVVDIFGRVGACRGKHAAILDDMTP